MKQRRPVRRPARIWPVRVVRATPHVHVESKPVPVGTAGVDGVGVEDEDGAGGDKYHFSGKTAGLVGRHHASE